jgi:hypothetical protein
LFLVDVIARSVHHFPVSPIELTTVAYVLCGILTSTDLRYLDL